MAPEQEVGEEGTKTTEKKPDLLDDFLKDDFFSKKRKEMQFL